MKLLQFFTTSQRNKNKKIKDITSFIKVDVKNPKKAPIAALKACLLSVLLNTISPINAPKKAPIKIPKGMGENNPIRRPTMVPIAPARLPPKRFVPNAGIK